MKNATSCIFTMSVTCWIWLASAWTPAFSTFKGNSEHQNTAVFQRTGFPYVFGVSNENWKGSSTQKTSIKLHISQRAEKLNIPPTKGWGSIKEPQCALHRESPLKTTELDCGQRAEGLKEEPVMTMEKSSVIGEGRLRDRLQCTILFWTSLPRRQGSHSHPVEEKWAPPPLWPPLG